MPVPKLAPTKSPIKKKILPSSNGYMYAELNVAAKALDQQKPVNGYRMTNPGDAEKAFGDKMNDPKFKKQLKKLQQDKKVIMLA
jgi:hypothetical protein